MNIHIPVKNLFLVGLTGTYGSGKSTVAQLLKKKGAFLIDCDRLAHEALAKDKAVASKVAKLFGLKNPDRARIAKEVFQNSAKRKQLESMIHPYVFRRIDEVLIKVKRGIVVIEIPLLFETGFDRCVDRTAAVSASKRMIFSRMAKKGNSRNDVMKRWDAQLSNSEKCNRADFVINNGSNYSKLKKDVDGFWRKLVQISGLDPQRS